MSPLGSGVHVVLVGVQDAGALNRLLTAQPWVGTVRDAETVGTATDLDDATVLVVQAGGTHDTLEALVTLRSACQGRILVLSPRDGAFNSREVLAAGADGLLPQDAEHGWLLDAIRTVAVGGFAMDTASLPIVPRSGAFGRSQTDTADPLSRLTPRERQVTRLLAQGLTNQQIAASLGLSDKTIRNLIGAILAGTGLPDRATLIEAVRRHG